MTTTDHRYAPGNADHFGRAVAARLSAGAGDLPYEVRERLRAARTQALARRKRVVLAAAPVVIGGGGAATLGGGEEFSLWRRVASALPIIVLVAGVVLIHKVQTDIRASEVAEVDAALLTDDLPPAAYSDPGFVQFLKAGRE